MSMLIPQFDTFTQQSVLGMFQETKTIKTARRAVLIPGTTLYFFGNKFITILSATDSPLTMLVPYKAGWSILQS